MSPPVAHVKWTAPGPEWNPFTAGVVRGLESIGVRVERTASTFSRTADFVVLQFPEHGLNDRHPVSAAVRAARIAAGVVTLRALGVSTVWIVHNVEPHDHPHPALARTLFRTLAALCGQVFLSEAAHVAAREVGCLNRRPQRVVVSKHPLYSHEELHSGGRADPFSAPGSRPGGTEGIRLVHLGRLRPYKGSDRLLTMAAGVDELANGAQLTIIGPAPPNDDARYRALMDVARGRSVHCELRPLTSDELVARLSSADAYVLLGDASLHNSGSAIFALALGVPVVLRDGPAAHELTADFPGWVATVPPGCDDLDEVAAAATALRPSGHPEPPPGTRRWEDLARSILSVSGRVAP